MANITFKTEGFAEFEQQLEGLSKMFRADLVARNTMVKAVKQALVPAYDTAYSLAKLGPPNNVGIHMKETLRIDSRIPNASDKLSDHVRDSDAVIGILSVKKSAVSLANEFGTAKMKARPFLRPAFESNLENITNTLQSELSYLIPAYAEKLRKKGYK